MWTKPVYRNFVVELPKIDSPLIGVWDRLEQIIERKKIVVIPVVGILISIILYLIVGGGKIVFYSKLFIYRLKNVFGFQL